MVAIRKGFHVRVSITLIACILLTSLQIWLGTNVVISQADLPHQAPTTPSLTRPKNKLATVVVRANDGPHQPFKPVEEKTGPTLTLLRSIGNALPPRHHPEQAIRNLNFTLQHEILHPNVRRHWVLNRLVDSLVESRLVDMLSHHGENYSIISFDLATYAQIPYVFDYHRPEGIFDLVHDQDYVDTWSDSQRELFEAAIQHEKILYTTNVNGARNFMLDIGQSHGTDWILPWDGNCFVTRDGFAQIYDHLTQLQLHQQMPKSASQPKKSSDKYVIVPMVRVVHSNDDLLLPGYVMPEAKEEPQIMFHKSALGRFHPQLRYGRRNKVELLLRLRVPGIWNGWKWLPWEKELLQPPILQPLPDLPRNTRVSTAGWVTRLYSGISKLETKGAIHKRRVTRASGIETLLAELDMRVAVELHNFTCDKFLFYDESILQRERQLYSMGDSQVNKTISHLLELAQQSLSVGPWSVMDKPTTLCAPSNDCHDFVSLPGRAILDTNSAANAGKQHVRSDSHAGSLDDRARLAALQHNVTILALAFFMTGHDSYAIHAANAVRVWFLNHETRMNPHLQYAEVDPEMEVFNGTAVVVMKDVYFFLDAIRILQAGGFFTATEKMELQLWFTQYMEWLESGKAAMTFTSRNIHGLYYDLQIVSIASFLNRMDKVCWYMYRSSSRLLEHMRVNDGGVLVPEVSLSQCEHYQMLILQGWSDLARIGEKIGINLWEVVSPSWNRTTAGSSLLCHASEIAVPSFGHRRNDPRSANDQHENNELWWPIVLSAREHCLNKSSWNEWSLDQHTAPKTIYELPDMFDTHDGIAPFWNLGHAFQPI